MRHTPHPDALHVRLHRGSQREACKGAWGKERVEFYYQVVLEVGMQVNKIKFRRTETTISINLTYNQRNREIRISKT